MRGNVNEKGDSCMLNVLQNLTRRLTERQQARAADLWALAKRIAQGDEPPVDEVEAALAKAGKTVDDLRQLVQTACDRVKWQQTLEQLPQLEREAESLRSQLEAAERELEQAQQKYEKKSAPITARLEQLQTLLAEKGAIRNNLLRTCPDPVLRTRYDELTKQLQQARAEHSQLNARINDLERRAREARLKAAEIRRSWHPGTEVTPNPDELEQRAAQWEKEAAELKTQLEQLEQRIDQLEKDRSEVEEQMISV